MRSETIAGLLFVMCVWSASPAFPQSAAPAAAPPAFEVASVKLSGPREFGVGMFTYSGGRIVITQCTLKMLMTSGVTGKPNRPHFMRAYNASMELFASKRLTDELRLPVIDRTGLTGSFDFFFEYADRPETAPEAPTIFNVLQDLGLKLVAARGPVRHLVIDQAEPASEN